MTPTASCFMTGTLRHRRFSPIRHHFSYALFMAWIDLDELPALPLNRRWRWLRFQRSDYLGPIDQPLKQAVLDQVEPVLGQRPQGPVRMLTNLRMGGLCFNPITLYYCFNEASQLVAIVGEVSNTPWLERHTYVHLCDPTQSHHQAFFDKQMHVSPFNPMAQQYRWRFNTPSDRLDMHMDNIDPDGQRPFDATLSLERRDDLGFSTPRLIYRHPWMSLKVIAAIHFEALRLWLKRAPIYDHPGRSTSTKR